MAKGDLVAVQKEVSIGGSTHTRTYWMKPADAEKAIAEGAKATGKSKAFKDLSHEEKKTVWKQAGAKAAATKKAAKEKPPEQQPKPAEQPKAPEKWKATTSASVKGGAKKLGASLHSDAAIVDSIVKKNDEWKAAQAKVMQATGADVDIAMAQRDAIEKKIRAGLKGKSKAELSAIRDGKAATKATGFTPTGEAAGGSQGGKWYKDADGTRYFGKDYKGNAERVANEHVTNAIYREMGVSAPQTEVHNIDGKQTLMSKAMEGEPAHGAGDLAKTNLSDGFVVDAWLANWDVVGLEYDNVLVQGGEAHRIDNGGALVFRAMGGDKDLPDHVPELATMRNSSKAPQSASVFGKLSDEDVAKQIDDFEVKYKSAWPSIEKAIDASDYTPAQKATVKTKLKARADWLIGDGRKKLRGK